MADLAGSKIAFFGFTGPLDSTGVTRIAAAFNTAVNGNYDEVHLCFSSLGGYVADGIFLYNHVRSLPIKVVTHNTGSVSSIAVLPFLAAAERYCSAHSMFLIHPTAFPTLDGMSAERLQAFLNSALADDERTEAILRERTRLTDDFLNARRFRDVYITPQVALEHGLVDGIAEFALPAGNQIIQI
jgi:ATP-dependent protease ClpP protease subunit